ncbi:hypothetical protein QEH56_21140 [Pelagicoccus enzymogenes]|uniref:hypothetical protein n=1 Tax=Pelagicoccus enzymogenes TaxID=2773457 RepID=UPI00280CEFCA|nr:hypothetical protein [Pelagicoccus enzymogenes]MDQ8200686.1 hypothetical protein [Pelagicoccus enzymogenes]
MALNDAQVELILEKLTRLEVLYYELVHEKEQSLVTMDWIRKRLEWKGVSDDAARQRLSRKGLSPVTGLAYRRSEVERAYNI